MTLTQLRSFSAVARLGSVKAAARALGVSEPAISGAIAALRRELGDELFVRDASSIRITPGGRELAARAVKILGLAEETRRAVAEARGQHTQLRVALTSIVSESVSGPLLAAFTRRRPNLEVSVTVEAAAAFADLLADRRVDVTLGPRPETGSEAKVDAVPFLRHQLIVVVAPTHPLAHAGRLTPATLEPHPWLVGPFAIEPTTPEGRFLDRNRLRPDLRAFPSHAAALSAAVAGEGVLLALAHLVRHELTRGTLVRLHVAGTPQQGLWHAAMLPPEHRPPIAAELRRFVATPEATQAILTGTPGVPAERFRPAVYVTIWS